MRNYLKGTETQKQRAYSPAVVTQVFGKRPPQLRARASVKVRQPSRGAGTLPKRLGVEGVFLQQLIKRAAVHAGEHRGA
jgi:hypothetical protein